jgi:hypothetical protein
MIANRAGESTCQNDNLHNQVTLGEKALFSARQSQFRQSLPVMVNQMFKPGMLML